MNKYLLQHTREGGDSGEREKRVKKQDERKCNLYSLPPRKVT